MTDTKLQSLTINMAKIEEKLTHIVERLEVNDKEHEWSRINQEKLFNKMEDFINSANDTFVRKADHKEVMRIMGETVGQLDNKINCLDKKFAPKLVWDVFCWAGGAAGTIGIGWLLYLIINTFLHINK